MLFIMKIFDGKLSQCSVSTILNLNCKSATKHFQKIKKDFDGSEKSVEEQDFLQITNQDISVITWTFDVSVKMNLQYTGNEKGLIQNSYQKSRFYKPCDHQGKCTEDNCDCVAKDIMCESKCGCSVYCLNQFFGCQCKSANECNKSLGEKSSKIKCECFKHFRECDPNRCRGCCGNQDEIVLSKLLMKNAKYSKYNIYETPHEK